MKVNWFKWANVTACACGIAGAYTSFKYNWLNVGGGASRFTEFWIVVDGILGYLAPAIWLAALALIAILDWRHSLAPTNRIVRLTATFFMTPAVFFTANWLFHIGFSAPVM